MKTSNRLTYKQRLFIEKYLKFKGNGTKAALAVYSVNNRNSAAVIASQNLSMQKIRRIVDDSFDNLFDIIYPHHP